MYGLTKRALTRSPHGFSLLAYLTFYDEQCGNSTVAKSMISKGDRLVLKVKISTLKRQDDSESILARYLFNHIDGRQFLGSSF